VQLGLKVEATAVLWTKMKMVINLGVTQDKLARHGMCSALVCTALASHKNGVLEGMDLRISTRSEG
jgi:hypothetical protein